MTPVSTGDAFMAILNIRYRIYLICVVQNLETTTLKQEWVPGV